MGTGLFTHEDGGSLTKSGNYLEAEAKRPKCNAVQLALAWLLQKSPVMLPIPGTANITHLEQNMAAVNIQLSPEEWQKIEACLTTNRIRESLVTGSHLVTATFEVST